jgi:phosphoribosyl 1,2-cyclic phosphate phosphodiesterase
MPAELIILGCGDSAGTPRIGNFWGACDSQEPKNRRTRPSICVRDGETTIIVDTGPDFKEQMNRHDIKHIDGVLYTHAHSDHVNGIDDLKPYHDRERKRLSVYMNEPTFTELKRRSTYLFVQESQLYPAILEPYIWKETDFGIKHKIGAIELIPFVQHHGNLKTIGYRFGNIGYSTDVIDLDDAAVDALKGIDTWIVDGANLYDENPIVHFNLRKIQEYAGRIGVHNIFLTHMKFNLDYKTLTDTLPYGIMPAHDGLTLKVEY